jgi:hypothetical protein
VLNYIRQSAFLGVDRGEHRRELIAAKWSILKWLALTLFAYVITAFVIGPDWRAVAHDTFIPSLPGDMRHGR